MPVQAGIYDFLCCRCNLPLFSQETILLAFGVTSPLERDAKPTINLAFPVRGTMRTITLDLTDRLHNQVQELAKKNNISVNLFVAGALADRVSALLTEEHLAEQRQKKHDSQT